MHYIPLYSHLFLPVIHSWAHPFLLVSFQMLPVSARYCMVWYCMPDISMLSFCFIFSFPKRSSLLASTCAFQFTYGDNFHIAFSNYSIFSPIFHLISYPVLHILVILFMIATHSYTSFWINKINIYFLFILVLFGV